MTKATRSDKETSEPLELILGEDDKLDLRTVGIDIGSATSQIVFSELTLERRGNRYETTARSVTYQSEVLLTPFTSDKTIDGKALESFFGVQYDRAGMTPADVDTGAVILTGVALLRHNAESIAEIFAEYSGHFVSVAAGDEIEAMLAAHGSGAVAASRDGDEVINVDVGGGTTKLSLCVDGRVEMSAAIDVGARLLAWDTDGRLIRLEPAGAAIARAAEVPVALGEMVSPEHRARLVAHMAAAVADATVGQWASPSVSPLLRTAPLRNSSASTVIVSGGVANYLAGNESRTFGDLGPDLAEALAAALARRGIDLQVASRALRATALGAGQFTVQVSGTTIHVSDRSALPLRSAPVSDVKAQSSAGRTGDDLTERVEKAIAVTPFDARALVLSLDWVGSADFATLDHFCRSVLAGVEGSGRQHEMLVLVVQHDVANLIGRHLTEELAYDTPLVVIDGVELERFDFVDVGDYLPHSASIPVTVKSLAF